MFIICGSCSFVVVRIYRIKSFVFIHHSRLFESCKPYIGTVSPLLLTSHKYFTSFIALLSSVITYLAGAVILNIKFVFSIFSQSKLNTRALAREYTHSLSLSLPSLTLSRTHRGPIFDVQSYTYFLLLTNTFANCTAIT